MELSILVAKIIALVYLATGIAALSGTISFKKLVNDFNKSSGLTFIAGFISLVIGVVLVQYHNIWVKDWPVLITIIGWASLIKGVVLIVNPEYISLFKSFYKKNTKAWGVLMIILGLVFAYLGFLS